VTSLVVRQYRDTDPLQLSAETLQHLLTVYGNRIEVRPAGAGDVILRGTNYVGLVRTPAMDVVIQPKIPTLSVFWMLGFADRLIKFDPSDFPFDEESGLLDLLARLFARRTEAVLRRGLYRAYVERVENLRYVRGRIAALDDFRTNRGLRHRVVCRYAELTADVPHNQILRAVTEQLLRYEFRLPGVRRLLAWNGAHLEEVSFQSVSARDFPRLTYDRLNAHYSSVLALAELIVRHMTFEFETGVRRAPGFLVDMDRVFQEFLTQLVREVVRGTRLAVRARGGWFLDEQRAISIDPDIVLTEGGRPVAAIDAKYKRHDAQADVYQALAYAKGLGLRQVCLLYPGDGEVQPADHDVRHDGTRVLVRTVPIGHHGRGFGHLETAAVAAIRGVLNDLDAWQAPVAA
jgi:5-methylcytosine-specific restriction enzyme subunit McrC